MMKREIGWNTQSVRTLNSLVTFISMVTVSEQDGRNIVISSASRIRMICNANEYKKHRTNCWNTWHNPLDTRKDGNADMHELRNVELIAEKIRNSHFLL